MAIGQFVDGNGKIIQGQEVVIPILKLYEAPKFECIGTGFFIEVGGIFVTAAHVFKEVLDPDGKPILNSDGSSAQGLATVQFIPPNNLAFRPIEKISFNKVADVAVGVARTTKNSATGEILMNKVVTLTNKVPQVGENISTWAYPNTVAEHNEKTGSIEIFPKLYEGKVLNEFPDGRDTVMLPGPCYETDLGIEGGASGGPVFTADGHVFGVNSTGFENSDTAFVSHIQSIGGLPVAHFQTADGEVHENILISELIEKGSIRIQNPTELKGQ